MAQTCTRCSRVNPGEAAYCYFDGSALPGHSRNGGPVAVGSQAFANAFVFPSGRSVRNFDELALACQNDWKSARQVLEQGFLEGFLSSLGRSDLAMAAREAKKFPDRDRGLDQFLAKLPTQALEPPKLAVDRNEVNLGVLPVNTDRKFDLHIENKGMRLLYGSVSCGDCLWLAVGDAPGAPEKIFDCSGDVRIPVHVRGKHLRAGNKPLEGQLVIESNGGTLAVTVRAEVPIKPFATGVLAGAKTPRQIAEKAKGAPKESASLFEKGAVAKWYKENGWTYPVQGPSSSGLGAVQQFFEALGLTPPPKVDISERSVALRGDPGQPLRHVLEVKAQEKRPVYAHAVSNQPWLEVGRAKLNGRTATIPLVVPSIPDRQGETLTAKVLVTSNGNQRFVVPVTLVIGGGFAFGTPIPQVGLTDVPGATHAPEAFPAPMAVVPTYRSPGGSGKHLWPALLLLLAILCMVGWDLAAPKKQDDGQARSQGGPQGGMADQIKLDDSEPRVNVQFNERMRYGVLMVKSKDPRWGDKAKQLTYQEDGGTNNTCIRLDGYENLFGQSPGKWKVREKKDKNRPLWTMSVWDYPTEQVEVMQEVQVVAGEQTRLLDTCLVRYTIVNKSTVTHKVGLRVMLDTYIGANDGVPFVIPGQPGLLDTMRRFPQKEIPDFIQALENPDLKNPGTIAHMGLKLPSDELEPIESMLICRWPGNAEMRWNLDPIEPMNANPEKKDSCVTLYWADRQMSPKEVRKMAFSYGLSKISSLDSGNSRLSVTVGGSFRPKGEFTVTAYVKDAQKGQTAKLTLPKGLSLLPGQDAEQTIDRVGELSQASWKVTSDAAGDYTLKVESTGPGQPVQSENYKIRIVERKGSIFD